MKTCAKIQFERNSLEIRNFFFSQEDAENGNPYNCFFDLCVISGPFSGVSSYEYDIKQFKIFVDELKEMYAFQTTKAELNDIGYGSRVVFHMDGMGHFIIEGLIYGEARQHSLRFAFEADQTVLNGFIKDLENLMK